MVHRKRIIKTCILLCGMSLTAQASSSSSYTLAAGQEGAERLSRQNVVMFDNAQDHLKKAGLDEGQTVMDVGCGGGDMTLYLAKVVGPTGHVVALDISEKQLDVTRSKMQGAGFQNVTYIQWDIQDKNPAPPAVEAFLGKMDLAYAKLVFMHLTDVPSAVANIEKLLKRGGVCAVQDSIWSLSPCNPHYEPMEQYCGNRIALGDKRKQDCKIGARLEALFSQAPWMLQMYRVLITPKILGGEGGYIVNFRAALKESRHHFLSEGIMSEAELVALEQALAAEPPSETIVHLTQAYSIAKKT